MQILAIYNQKGGVGKTTTAINVGAALADAGYKVLLIDLDGQCSLTKSLAIDQQAGTATDLLSGDTPEPQTTEDINGRYYVIPAENDIYTVGLSGTDQLKKALRKYNKFDYILLDCPPALSAVTTNALAAANKIIIPMQAEYLAMESVIDTVNTLQQAQKRINPQLVLSGVVITRYDNRLGISKEIAEQTAAYFKDKMFNTRIRNNVALVEAQANSQDIFIYKPKSNGARDYKALTEELLNR